MTLTELQRKICQHKTGIQRNREFSYWLRQLDFFDNRNRMPHRVYNRLSYEQQVKFRQAVLQRLKRAHDTPTMRHEPIDLVATAATVWEMLLDVTTTDVIIETHNDHQQLKPTGRGLKSKRGKSLEPSN